MRNLYLTERSVKELPFTPAQCISFLEGEQTQIAHQATDGTVYLPAGCIPGTGRLLACSSQEDGSLLLCTQSAVMRLEAEITSAMVEFETPLRVAAFSHDNRYLLTVDRDYSLRVFDFLFSVDIVIDLADMQAIDLAAINQQVSVGWGRKETQFHGSGNKLQAQAAPTPIIREDLNTEDVQPQVAWRPDSVNVAVTFSHHDTLLVRMLVLDIAQRSIIAVSEPLSKLLPPVTFLQDSASSIFVCMAQSVAGATSRVLIVEKNGLQHGEFDTRRHCRIRALASSPQYRRSIRGEVLVAVTFEDNVVQLWARSNYHWSCKFEEAFGDSLLDVAWTSSYELSVCTGTHQHALRFQHEYSPAFSPSPRYSLVAVVDGTDIKVTPFAQCNVPPPMSLLTLDGGFVARHFAFHENDESVQLNIWGADQFKAFELKPTDNWSVRVLEIQNAKAMPLLDDTIRGLPCGDVIVRSNDVVIDEEILVGGVNCVYGIAELSLLLCVRGESLHFLDAASKSTMHRDLSARDDQHYRFVEAGTCVVTHCLRQGSVVLQMPRGNLEVVYPRPLVMHMLRELLGRLEYREAFLLARRHRLDWNLFVTPVWQASVFVRQIPESSYLSVFMANLSTENQRLFLPQIIPLLNVASQYEAILTGHGALDDLPAMLDVLTRVVAASPSDSERALKFALFVANGERLFRCALRRLHLPLALSIAKRTSTMDPTDYEPLLQRFHGIADPSTRKYAVCEHLGDWPGCFEVINGQSDDERSRSLREFLQSHPAECKSALVLVEPGDSAAKRLICQHMLSLETLADRERAICQVHSQQTDTEKVVGLMGKDDLASIDDECLALLGGNLMTAVDKAVAAGKLGHAIQYARMANVDISARITDYVHSQAQSLAESRNQLEQLWKRLHPLQERFVVDPVAFVESFSNRKPGDVDDGMSQMSLGTRKTQRSKLTSASRLTTATSKTRWRDRPGTLSERDYLVHTLTELASRIHRSQLIVAECVRACEVLMLCRMGRSLLDSCTSLYDSYNTFCRQWMLLMERQLQRAQHAVDLASVRMYYEDWHVASMAFKGPLDELSSALF